MTVMIHEEHRLAAAEHIARKVVRLQKSGDAHSALKAQHRLCDVVGNSRWPHVMLGNLVKNIGRANSLAVDIDRKVVDFVLGS